MKIPKRLPRDLKALVELEEAFGRLTLLSADMRRRKGAASIQLTYMDGSDTLVTIDADMYYNKYERKIEEQSQTHRRNINVFRKAVLAS
jgi:hypothetical protein